MSVGRTTVEGWISGGWLKSVILPNEDRARRVTRAALEAFILAAEIEHGFRRHRAIML